MGIELELVGSLGSGVLEKLTPHKSAELIEMESDQPAESYSGRARGMSKKAEAEGQRARKVATSGHTLYIPDALFERIMVQVHRRKKTISEYVSLILERQVPDYRTTRADAEVTARPTIAVAVLRQHP